MRCNTLARTPKSVLCTSKSSTACSHISSALSYSFCSIYTAAMFDRCTASVESASYASCYLARAPIKSFFFYRALPSSFSFFAFIISLLSSLVILGSSFGSFFRLCRFGVSKEVIIIHFVVIICISSEYVVGGITSLWPHSAHASRHSAWPHHLP